MSFGAGGDDPEGIPVRALLNPSRVTVNLGSGNYTVFADPSELSNEELDGEAFANRLTGVFADGEIIVGSVSEADFAEVLRAVSVRADFPFAIPLAGFCAEYGLDYPIRLSGIDAFTGIVYSEAAPDSVLLANAEDERYFRISSPEIETGFGGLIARIRSGRHTSFYPLKSYTGVENDLLIPMDAEMRAVPVAYRNDLDPSDPETADRATRMAKGIFGDAFDFTRKITEGNGDTLYLYGYGERTLVIRRDGGLEYSETPSGTDGVVNRLEALNIALRFIALHDETGAHGATPRPIYLKRAEAGADGRGGFRFSFGIRVNGLELCYPDADPLVVEVTGRRVTYYARDIVLCEPADAQTRAKPVCAPFDILTEHFQYMYGRLNDAQAAPDGPVSPETMFEFVVAEASALSPGYLRSAADAEQAGDGAAFGGTLIPVWVLTAAGVDFYFGLYDGEPLGASI